MATHSSIFVWEISWSEEPSGLQSMGSQRVRRNWATKEQQSRINWQALNLGDVQLSLKNSPALMLVHCLSQHVPPSLKLASKAELGKGTSTHAWSSTFPFIIEVRHMSWRSEIQKKKKRNHKELSMVHKRETSFLWLY